MFPTKKPVDTLKTIGAPRELVEWVRKMPSDEAVRKAWIDVNRVEWLPYLAILRGISKDAIVRATCECALEAMSSAPASPELERCSAALRGGRDALIAAEDGLDDLRRTMLAHGEVPDAPAWMPWARLVLELARATKRGNPMIGVGLALRMLVGHGGRRAQSDLIARFRDHLLLAGT